jgi:hypothetical protein
VFASLALPCIKQRGVRNPAFGRGRLEPEIVHDIKQGVPNKDGPPDRAARSMQRR